MLPKIIKLAVTNNQTKCSVTYYKKFENTIKTENKTIYHYTSSDSMCKILSNKCIWFSNANYLNDEIERTYIYRLLKRRVEKHKFNGSFKKEVLRS